jgi:hypothetical protein
MVLRHDFAVTRDDAREVEFLERIECAHPVFGEPIVQERHPVDQCIAGRNHLLLGQIDEHVAVGVSAAEQQDLNFASALIQRH